jgi:hypothetical protein
VKTQFRSKLKYLNLYINTYIHMYICGYLVFNARHSALITPVKVGGEIVGGKDWSFVGVSRKPNTLQAKELSPEFRRSEIGKLGDAVDGAGVQLLVKLGSAQVGLEHAEPVVVLLLTRITLPELGLEGREMALRVEQRIVGVRYHLADQEIVVNAVDVEFVDGGG